MYEFLFQVSVHRRRPFARLATVNMALFVSRGDNFKLLKYVQYAANEMGACSMNRL